MGGVANSTVSLRKKRAKTALGVHSLGIPKNHSSEGSVGVVFFFFFFKEGVSKKTEKSGTENGKKKSEIQIKKKERLKARKKERLSKKGILV